MYYQAKKLAKKQSGKAYYLTAIAYKNGKMLDMAANLHCHGPHKMYHAETRLTRKVNLKGTTVEVMRFNSVGLAMARPCPNCEKALRKAGVKKIRYTNEVGGWSTLKL